MPERRRYPRFTAWLPLRLTAVAGKIEPATVTLLTQNISKAGVCFPAPRRIEPGQFIEVEVALPGIGPGSKDVQNIRRRLHRADRIWQQTGLV